MTSLRLVYITGKGHSGSTLLDMLIGSHSECITLGEIHQLTLKAEGVCACGAANYRECEFWRDVDSRLRADGLAGLSALHVDSADQDEFRHSNHALFRVLQEKTNARWFVDSSKKLPRLKSLLSDPSLDVVPIHIVRRPEGVICSNMAKGRDFDSSLRSYYSGLWARYKYLRGRPYILVSYEQLCSRPEYVLTQVMKRLGLSFESGQLDWSSHDHHNVNGNKRTRTTRQSSIRLDERWRRNLSVRQRLLVKKASIKFKLRLLRCYGAGVLLSAPWYRC